MYLCDSELFLLEMMKEVSKVKVKNCEVEDCLFEVVFSPGDIANYRRERQRSDVLLAPKKNPELL